MREKEMRDKREETYLECEKPSIHFAKLFEESEPFVEGHGLAVELKGGADV